tara:strand:- start:2948 stop:3775 length:828 start_codon:yes stop_codon:yes gene_type:complete
MKKEKILVVIPTTAGRLNLLDKVLDSLYSNVEFDLKTIIVKNGTVPDEVFMNYNFKYPNIIKTISFPGGHISKAMNKGLEYFNNEDWFLYQEDDYIIHDKDWLSKIVDLYKSIPNCGVFGTRLHGGQRKYNPQQEYTIESLKIRDKNTFETYWTDGITLVKGDIMRKHNIKYDEDMMTVPNADLCLQMLENNYENWRTELDFTHYHTPGSKTGTPKWKYANIPIDMKEGDCKIHLKYNGCGNQKIQEWVDMDTQVAAKWLKDNNRNKESYKSFKL